MRKRRQIEKKRGPRAECRDCHIYGSYRREEADKTSQEGAKKKTKGLGCHGDKRLERVRSKCVTVSDAAEKSSTQRLSGLLDLQHGGRGVLRKNSLGGAVWVETSCSEKKNKWKGGMGKNMCRQSFQGVVLLEEREDGRS